MRRRAAAAALCVAFATIAAACGGGGGRILVAEFDDVGDLVARANVQQSDAVIGSVRNIELIERNGDWLARVTMALSDEAILGEDMGAVVRSTSLLGEKFVDLIPPPEGRSAAARDVVIPTTMTRKAPELETVLSELGAIAASGGVESLAVLTSAGARILEGQEETLGTVLDQTAELVGSLHRQREALASAIDDLGDASATLAASGEVIDRALDVSDDALSIVASQQAEIDELLVRLDELAQPLANLTREHAGDIDAQVKALIEIVPKVHEVRDTLDAALTRLPNFTQLFPKATPGDYVQLDAFVEALPIGDPANDSSLLDFLLEATR